MRTRLSLLLLACIIAGLMLQVRAEDLATPADDAAPAAPLPSSTLEPEEPEGLSMEQRITRLEDKERLRSFIARYNGLMNDVVSNRRTWKDFHNFVDKYFTDGVALTGATGKEEVKQQLMPLLMQYSFLRHYIGELIFTKLNETHAEVEGPLALIGTYTNGHSFSTSMYTTWYLRKEGNTWKLDGDKGHYDYMMRHAVGWGEDPETAYYQQQQQQQQQQQAYQAAYGQPQYQGQPI